MNPFRISRTLLATSFVVLTLPGHTKTHKKLPNVIIIMADDLGYGDPKCYNKDSKIPTPNMDRLCEQGVRFTDAHSAASVCTPSRYALLTGQYAWRSDLKKTVLWSGYDEPLITPGRPTLASVLQNHGYTTAMIGKWHLGLNFSRNERNSFVEGKDHHYKGKESARDVSFTSPIYGGPNYLGFDYSFISAAGHNMEPFCYIENDYTAGIPDIWREALVELVPGVSASETSDGWMVEGWDDRQHGPNLTAKAVNFIKESTNTNPSQPFFLNFCTVSPHRPCTPPDFIKGKSEAGERGDMVAEFDWSVGKIMKTLDELGIAENTMLIVTSDNGGVKVSDDGKDYGHKSCGNLRGFKATLYEGGHRVPLIIRWPAVLQANTTNDALVCLVDFFATISSMVGQKPAALGGEDSFDMMPLFKSGKQVRKSLVMHAYDGSFAIRNNEWKLILPGNQNLAKRNELYNLKTDPYETINLIDKYPEIVRNLTRELNHYKWQGHSVETNHLKKLN